MALIKFAQVAKSGSWIVGTRPTNVLNGLAPVQTERGAATDAAFYLVFVNPPGRFQYREFPLRESPTRVGRGASCEIAIDRSEMSREHAVLTREGTTWILRDNGSTNGTLVDGAVVTEARLSSGMHFHLGHSEFVLLDRDHPELVRFRRYFADQRHDELTSLPNSRALDELLTSWESAAPCPLSVALVDVDGFAALVAEMGPSWGEEILKDIAAKFSNRIQDESVFRLPDRRFAVVYDRSLEEAETELKGLLDSVRQGVALAGHRALTFSAGLVGTSGARNTNAQELLASADRALERAIRLGGGRVWADRREFNRGDSEFETRTSVEITVPPTLYFRRSLRAFQDVLDAPSFLFAVEIADRQLLAVTNERLFEKLERSLDNALRTTVAKGEPPLSIGEGINGHPVLVAVEGTSHAAAAAIAADIDKNFKEQCHGEAVNGRLVFTRATKVTSASTAIAEVMQGLAAQHRQPQTFLPLPIGHALRLVDDATSNEQRFFSLVRLQQAIVRWFFAALGAEFVRVGSEATPPRLRLDELLQQPVSDGSWVSLVRSYVDSLSQVTPERLVLPAYVEMLTASDSHVLTELEQFSSVRNRFAHGQDVHAKAFVEEWAPRLKALLAGPLAALGDHAVRYVVRVDNIDESVFDVHYKNLMGDNLAADTSIETRDTVIPQGRIVISNEGTMLGLSPFALYLRCPTCHTEEVFLLDRIQRGPIFRSLREGAHTVRLAEAGLDVRRTQGVLDSLDRALAASARSRN